MTCTYLEDSFLCFSARKPQPDNREFNESRNGEDEACIAVLNDFYQV